MYFKTHDDPIPNGTVKFEEIVAELASMMGGFASVLLQLADPRIATAIASHSSFTENSLKRGRRSLVYIYCMSMGEPDERQYIINMTNRAHALVKEKNIDVENVDLQLWVAATIYWSMINSFEAVYGKLKDRDAEEIYNRFSVLATSTARERWPLKRVDFENYWERVIPTLIVTQNAKDIAKDVLRPKGFFPKALPAWLFMLFFGHASRIITTEMLPESVRNAFDIPSTKYTRFMYRAIMRLIRNIYPPLPKFARQIVKTYYMNDMRRRKVRGDPW